MTIADTMAAGREMGAMLNGETPPADFTIHCPMPPSLNSIWRARRGAKGKPSFYLSRRYETWKRVFDNIILATRPKPRVTGHFTVAVTLNESKRRGDADNRLKGLLDALQRAGIVENDKLADRVTIGWGYAPQGCAIAIRAVVRPAEAA